jgi:hypothetical protein
MSAAAISLAATRSSLALVGADIAFTCTDRDRQWAPLTILGAAFATGSSR